MSGSGGKSIFLFFFFGFAARLQGSSFPDQGLIHSPCQWKSTESQPRNCLWIQAGISFGVEITLSKQELSQHIVWAYIIRTSNGPEGGPVGGTPAHCPTSPRGFVLGEALDPVVGVGRSMMGLIYNRKCLHSKEKKSTVGAIWWNQSYL